MTSNKSKYSPVQTRSRTRPTNLFGHTERKDSALLTSSVFNHSDYSTMTNAPSFYLDCEEVFSTSRKVTSLLVSDFSKPMCPIHFDDNLQYSQQTTCNVRTHSHGSQHQAFKVSTSQSFVADSISSLPSTPSNDQESMSSPHAQQWESARQDELNSCRANAVWSEPMHLPPGHRSVNLGFIYALKDSGNPKIPQ